MKALRDAIPHEARHPIAVVSERTGLSQDVLRVWERRYGAVKPTRDAGGQRHYTEDDIRRLVLLRAATSAGRSIRSVASLPTDQIEALIDGDIAARAATARERGARDIVASEPGWLPTEQTAAAEIVETALARSRGLDAPALDETLRRAATAMGMSAFIESVAAPLLRRVGDEWHAGRLAPPQEHLVSSVLHDIIVGTMRAFPQHPEAPRLLAATPALDRHAIGAALVGAVAALEGWSVIYLGADLPAADIADAARSSGAHVVAISVIYTENRHHVLGELRTLRSRLPDDVALIAGGSGATALAPELSALNIPVESSMSGLVAELRRRRPAR